MLRATMLTTVLLGLLAFGCGDDADDDGGVGGAGGGDSTIPSGTFLADAEGYVVFEMMSIAGDSPPSPWVFVSDPICSDDASAECAESLGNGVYQFTGASACGQTSETSEGAMEAQFQVAETGLYRVSWRNLRDHSGDCGDDRNNDSFMTFPTTSSHDQFKEPFKVFGGGHGEYNWTASFDIGGANPNKKPVCLEFDEGVHTLHISGRSQNHAIDRVAIIPIESGSLEDCQAWSVMNDLDDRALSGQAP